MNKAANVISWVLHPLFIPTYAFLLLFFTDPYMITFFPRQLFPFFMSLMLVNIIAPAVSIYMMKRRGNISSLEMQDKGERIGPIFIVLFYYALSYFLLKLNDFPIPAMIYGMILGMVISLAIALLITRVWKVSIHMLAIAGVLGALVAIFNHYQYVNMSVVYLLIALIGLVGFARLMNGHHSLAQVYVGAGLGYLINYTVVTACFYG